MGGDAVLGGIFHNGKRNRALIRRRESLLLKFVRGGHPRIRESLVESGFGIRFRFHLLGVGS